jgi:hypothetical protein
MEAPLPQVSPGARYLGCAVVALLALVGTWGHNVAYLPLSLGDKVGLAVLSALALTYLLWSFGWLG